MPITFHPDYGTLLFCDFNHQSPPEMVKNRPVVVLSRRKANSGLCTVVPLSGTDPGKLECWHHKMTHDKLPEKLRNMAGDWWAKCDCLTSVSLARLERIRNGRCPNTGKRLYITPKLYGADLDAIKLAVINHLGMMDLIPVKQ